MLLDELIAVIETLKQRITDHGPTLRVNETRTRMALIDPLLQVLGWDTTDLSIVVPEYDVRGRWTDYALLGQNRLPSAIIEAKKLGEPFPPHLPQVKKCSDIPGVAFAGITNGDHWELYEVVGPRKLGENPILNLKISASPPYLAALNLLLLWRPNLTSSQVVQTSKPIAVPSPIVGPVPPVSDPIDWVPLSNFVARKAMDRPEVIRFPDRSEHRLEAWYDLALQTIVWLCSKGFLTADHISEHASNDRYLFHTKKVHPSGKQFFNPKCVAETSLFFEANMSRTESTKKTKALLTSCGQDLTLVHLGVRSK